MKYFLKTIKNLIWLSSIFIYSCSCEQLQLSNNDKEWINCYNLYDTLIFKSKFNNYDTFFVSSKRDFHEECNIFEKGEHTNHTISIEIRPTKCPFDLDKFNRSSILPNYCLIEIEITKKDKLLEANPNIMVLGLEASKPHNSSEFSVGKYKYHSCYFFESGKSARNYGMEYLQSFYWDKYAGLVQYKTIKNEIFELL